MGDHEAAKAGIGNRVETFIKFLVAEKVLATRLAQAYQRLERSGRAIPCDRGLTPTDRQPVAGDPSIQPATSS
jgi:hypothetical protein